MRRARDWNPYSGLATRNFVDVPINPCTPIGINSLFPTAAPLFCCPLLWQFDCLHRDQPGAEGGSNVAAIAPAFIFSFPPIVKDKGGDALTLPLVSTPKPLAKGL